MKALVKAVLLGSCLFVTASAQTYGPKDNFTDRWTLEEAWGMNQTPELTTELITDWPRGDERTLPGYHIWDSWPVRNLDTTVATVDGYSVFIHLSVPEDVVPGKRHDIAQLRYSYTNDGENYTLGGLLFPGMHEGVVEGVVLGSRNWAGSAVLTQDNELYVFYTATGEAGENVYGGDPGAGSGATSTGSGSVQNETATQSEDETRADAGQTAQNETAQTDTNTEGTEAATQSGQEEAATQGATTGTAQTVQATSFGSGSVGEPRNGEITYEQRIAVAYGPKLVVTENGVTLEGEWQHDILLEADGEWYQTQEQADVGPLNAFRDPWVFRDPNDGNLYMLLEGNVGGANKSEQECAPEDIGSAAFQEQLEADGVEIPEEASHYNGNVGLAVSVDGSLTNWELLPPLLSATCVNQELERPLFVFQDGKYYLFVSSHIGKFAPIGDLQKKGAEGLYGFVSDSLRGDYQPLNGHGLVLANPEEQPFQAYSFDVVPVGETTPRLIVTSFVDYPTTDDIGAVGSYSDDVQLEGFGGTLAPTIELGLNDTQAQIVNTLDFGEIPQEEERAPTQ
jgi:levansucrase